MGYISIVEMLKKVTTKKAEEERDEGDGEGLRIPGREKCPVLMPEAMHESNISDSDEETGFDWII